MNDGGIENKRSLESQINVSFQILHFLFLLRVTFITLLLVAYFYAMKTFLNIETISQIVTIVNPESFSKFLIFLIFGLNTFAVYTYISKLIIAFNEMKASKDFTEKFFKEKLNG